MFFLVVRRFGVENQPVEVVFGVVLVGFRGGVLAISCAGVVRAGVSAGFSGFLGGGAGWVWCGVGF